MSNKLQYWFLKIEKMFKGELSFSNKCLTHIKKERKFKYFYKRILQFLKYTLKKVQNLRDNISEKRN